MAKRKCILYKLFPHEAKLTLLEDIQWVGKVFIPLQHFATFI